MAQLTCENLVLGYEGRAVVRDLNFEVNSGDYLCIVGENGSGKSTLIKALLGLKKPMSGEIRYGGGLEADEIGYLPQQTVVQRDFPASVREIVLSGCLNRTGFRPFYNRQEKKKASESLERLGIRSLEKTMLPGTVGRAAAESASGAGPVRHQIHAFAGRTGREPGSGRHAGDVRSSGGVKPEGKDHGDYGVP